METVLWVMLVYRWMSCSSCYINHGSKEHGSYRSSLSPDPSRSGMETPHFLGDIWKRLQRYAEVQDLPILHYCFLPMFLIILRNEKFQSLLDILLPCQECDEISRKKARYHSVSPF